MFHTKVSRGERIKGMTSRLVLVTTLLVCSARVSIGFVTPSSVGSRNHIAAGVSKYSERGHLCLKLSRDTAAVKTSAHLNDKNSNSDTRPNRFGRIWTWRRKSRTHERRKGLNYFEENASTKSEHSSNGARGMSEQHTIEGRSAMRRLRRVVGDRRKLNEKREKQEKESCTQLSAQNVENKMKAVTDEPKEHESKTISGNKPSTSNGVRVTFQASKVYERPLNLANSEMQLFLEDYMTLSPESYSLLSYKNDTSCGEERRWNVRRLTNDESAQYRTRQFAPYEQLKYDVIESEGNYFRFSIPLKPLVGINITPVIDAFVYTPALSMTNSESEKSNNSILVKSTRVSLLESDKLDTTNKAAYTPQSPGLSALVNMAPEAIEAIEKIEEIVTPRIHLSSRIYWSTGKDSGKPNMNRFMRNDKAYLGIETTVKTSFTIPPQLPVKLPRLVIKKIGSTIMDKILSKVLPKFLRQIELDFERWQDFEGK